MLGAILNARQKYFLTGEVWQGKSRMQSSLRLTLERFDSSHDSAFMLYRRDGGFITRVTERTVADWHMKWVIIKKGKYDVRVLRADLLQALEALA